MDLLFLFVFVFDMLWCRYPLALWSPVWVGVAWLLGFLVCIFFPVFVPVWCPESGCGS